MHKIIITLVLFTVLQASITSCASGGGSTLDKRKAKKEKIKKKKGATTCPWKDC